MRGIICAGGKGTRLGSFTSRVSNKHLALIYDRPMLEYPMRTLANAGIEDVTIVTSERSAGDIVRFVGNGKEWGFDSVNFAFQYGGDLGIADAVKEAIKGRNRSPVAVILGDNLFQENMSKMVRRFHEEQNGRGARMLLKFVADPERFGVAQIKEGRVLDIEEKPKLPKSPLAITGFYLFDERLSDIIEALKPSQRGEYEVTDILKWYLADGSLRFDMTEGFWTDCGTYDSLLAASNYVRSRLHKSDFDEIDNVIPMAAIQG